MLDADADCAFNSANVYARSTIGQDALANVSLEHLADGKLSGYIRIPAIALPRAHGL